MKLINDIKNTLFYLTLAALMSACHLPKKNHRADEADRVREVMQRHLDAVAQKNAVTLRETLSPEGEMQLILPQSEIIHSVNGFMKFHEDWFAVPGWTFETRILSSEVGEKLAVVITEIIYREPERDGLPYFNRMTVSYVLKKINDQWYIIKDHASSVEKSTDS